jgi:hypothetical protein
LIRGRKSSTVRPPHAASRQRCCCAGRATPRQPGLVVNELERQYSGSLPSEVIKACAMAAIRDLVLDLTRRADLDGAGDIGGPGRRSRLCLEHGLMPSRTLAERRDDSHQGGRFGMRDSCLCDRPRRSVVGRPGRSCGCRTRVTLECLAEVVGLVEVLADGVRRCGSCGVEVDVFDVLDAGEAEAPVPSSAAMPRPCDKP